MWAAFIILKLNPSSEESPEEQQKAAGLGKQQEKEVPGGVFQIAGDKNRKGFTTSSKFNINFTKLPKAVEGTTSWRQKNEPKSQEHLPAEGNDLPGDWGVSGYWRKEHSGRRGAEKSRYLPPPVCDACEKWGGFLQAAIPDTSVTFLRMEECLWNFGEQETSKEREVNDRQASAQ